KSICSSSRVGSSLIVITPFVGDPSTGACGPWSVVLHSLWCRTDRDCPLCGAGGAPRLGAPRTGSGTPGLGAPRAVWGAGCVDRVTCPGGCACCWRPSGRSPLQEGEPARTVVRWLDT